MGSSVRPIGLLLKKVRDQDFDAVDRGKPFEPRRRLQKIDVEKDASHEKRHGNRPLEVEGKRQDNHCRTENVAKENERKMPAGRWKEQDHDRWLKGV